LEICVKRLNFELKELCLRNRQGSYGTQDKRFHALQSIADDLYGSGKKQIGIHSLKAKWVYELIGIWRSRGCTPATIKNYMAHLRFWARQVGQHDIANRSNKDYGIADRQYISDRNKAIRLPEPALEKITDEYVRMSLQLQQAFGLRREEAIKFAPGYADRGDYIRLKASWTKGGKAREVPVITERQRAVLVAVTRLAGKGSLIPSERNFVQQLRIYERQTVNAGLNEMHGLRHQYAQDRYEALTGWKAPKAGGPAKSMLDPAQKRIDIEARARISKELGHERLAIVRIYIG
jgi:hypothetical protein